MYTLATINIPVATNIKVENKIIYIDNNWKMYLITSKNKYH